MYPQKPPKNPTLAAVLSFLINGLGQVYNGQIGKGILIFVVQIINVLLMSIVIGFITTPIVWIWSIYDAYKVANRINEETAQQVAVTTKVCPRCAERVNSDAQVCHYCGYQFMSEGAAIAAPPDLFTQPTGIAAPAAYAMPVAAAEQAPTEAAQSKFCPQCGSSSQVDARFCMSCGYSFEAPVPASVDGSLAGDEATIDDLATEL